MAKKNKAMTPDNGPFGAETRTPSTDPTASFPPPGSSDLPSSFSSRPAPNDPKLVPHPQQIDTSAHKFELERLHQEPPAPAHPVPAYEYLGELPDTYATRRLYLIARDPHWLFAYWDFAAHQIHEAEGASHDGKVFLQLYRMDGTRIQQIQIGPWARDWYLHVGEPNSRFYAEIGFYRHDGGFEILSRSGETVTPREDLSPDTRARFVTIPFNFKFSELLELIRTHRKDGEDLAETLARLQEEGFALPFGYGTGKGGIPTDGKEFLEYLNGETVRHLRIGSLDFTEVLRNRLESLLSSGQWAGAPSSLSSPFGASFGRPREFFMHVNAELIIYGGTDPNARVRVDGQEITLKPDGTFSYHFNFKDGKYHIPIEAVSPDGVERRSALLSFLRMTETAGGVTDTPQAPRPAPMGEIPG